ncbi:MAG: hypothetical protein ACOC1G_00415 [Phycisphaeraceae bacterium]
MNRPRFPFSNALIRVLLAVPLAFAAAACEDDPGIRVYDADRPDTADQGGSLAPRGDERPAAGTPDADELVERPASPQTDTQSTVAQPPANERPPIAIRRFDDRGGDMIPFRVGPIRGAHPAHWSPQTPEPPRLATFSVRGENYVADVAITRFPGAVGGELRNLNRWRDQVDLPPVDSTDAGESVDFSFGDTPATLTLVANRQTGPDGTAILVASIPDQEHTWFVKLTGPARMIDPEHGPMLNFLERLQLPDLEAQP